MTFEQAVGKIKANMAIIGMKNSSGDYVREFFIAPSDKDLFTEYMALYRMVRDHLTVSESLDITDFEVWVQITDYGLSSFVTLENSSGLWEKPEICSQSSRLRPFPYLMTIRF